MTDYVKSTNFSSKDSLASGNPLKIVKGTEFDIEFNNIATAITSKLDAVNAALTGIPTAPTAAGGTNTSQIATTAFVTTALQSLYPVGSIYINAGVSTNPATLLGFGTWVAFGAGRVMVGLNGADPLFDSLEETGGSKDAIVVSHSHTASSSSSSSFSGNALPSHSHTINSGGGGTSGIVYNVDVGSGTTSTSAVSAGTPSGTVSTSTSTIVNSAGSSGTNANLQPYITVAMWKRTA